jgi:hypothetical protein
MNITGIAGADPRRINIIEKASLEALQMIRK